MGSHAESSPAASRSEIACGGLHLTKKERDLLQYLRNNAGKCLSREQLLHDVWGYRNGVRSRTLDVHVQRLRRKLGPVEGSKILTVFRGGYLWADGNNLSPPEASPAPRVEAPFD